MQQGADDPEFLKTMFLANGYSKISGGKIQKDKYNILMSDIRYYMGGGSRHLEALQESNSIRRL